MTLLVAILGLFRISFGLIFFIVVAIAALVTLYNVMKSLSRHNAMSRELSQRANDNIRTEMMASMLVKQSGAFLWTRKNGVFHMDKAMQEYLQLDTDTDALLDCVDNNDPATKERILNLFRITKPGDYSVQFYGRYYNLDPHWFSIQMHLRETSEGLVAHGVTLIIDNIKRREEQTIDTQRMLIRAKERSEFLANMSHQIRTPLNIIIGFSQIMCEPDIKLDPDSVKDYGDEIAYHNSRLMKIIDDVLTTTLIGNSNIKMTLVPHDLKDFMNFSERDTVSTIIRKYNAEVTVKGAPSDCSVVVDRLFFCRVLDNLIDNAVIASGEHCTIAIDWFRNDDGTVTLQVIDHGCGIAASEQDKIFERFYRINKFGEGVGLGLSLAKALTEKMGGSISVESALGQGSTFSITMKGGK